MQNPIIANRHQALFNQMADNSIALICAAPMQYRNSDTEYPYRQNSHFYYLTGFEESASIAVFIKKQGECQFILFCQDKDPQAEQWTGPRVGLQDAVEKFGASFAFSIDDVKVKLPELFKGTSIVYYLINTDKDFERKIFLSIQTLSKKVRQGVVVPHQYIDLRVILDENRLIKSDDELQLMRKACEMSAHAHMKAMQQCQVGMFEYELEAILLQEFYRHGSRYPAYSSIVATGNNACTLHYTRNTAQIKNNDLVLIDAGAEYQYYAADITRTFPANGKFTKEQQSIYELVLASQTAAIEQVAPNTPWDNAQQTILNILVQGLVDLKILQGEVKTLIEEKAYFPFYMHNSGHWLGMDVHDVGEYKMQGTWRHLKPGMVFTIEPGLYISENNLNVEEKWRGIGVRIEDDIVVTKQGFDVLTKDVVKTPAEIEKLMKSR
ncbi:MAG: Xaa-Pro aminopeptidase [Gammaproteobacteria bacterium]|jgi:Xaa-Pro aminopeptidase|nr:Xaa-Pro aminopeptidase [Gammaproteobacteria bacterium]